MLQEGLPVETMYTNLTSCEHWAANITSAIPC